MLACENSCVRSSLGTTLMLLIEVIFGRHVFELSALIFKQRDDLHFSSSEYDSRVNTVK